MDLKRALQMRGIPFQMSAGDSDEIRVCCPYCQEQGQTEDTRFRLGLNMRKGIGHCFNCGWKSRKAVEEVGLKLELGELTLVGGTEKKKSPVVRLPEDFDKLFYEERATGLHKKALDYLYGRGVTRKQVKEKSIGVSLSGRCAYRVVFPVYYGGMLVGFVARDFTGRGSPRYLNSEGLKALYNLPRAKENRREIVVISEGVFDCLAIERLVGGIWNSVGSLGAALTGHQGERLAGYKEVVLFPDPDAAGVRGFAAIASQLQWAGFKVSAVLPFSNLDAADMRKEEIAKCLDSRVPWGPLTELKLRRIQVGLAETFE